MSNIIYNAETNTINWDELLKIPEFKALSETPQNILWHKEGNACVHTCMVVQRVLEYIDDSDDKWWCDHDYRDILVYAALLHDIGKSVTTVKGEDGLYHCPNHGIKGVSIAKNIIETYIPELEKYKKIAILSLVRHHMQPFYILKHRDPKKAILKLANELEGIGFEALLLLKKCDCEGSIPEKYDGYKEILEKVRELYYEVCSYPSGTQVYIRKLEDTDTCSYKPGHHPNGINVGYLTRGVLSYPVTKGFRTSLGFRFSTSPVQKIIDKNHFQTKNSVYEITEFKDKDPLCIYG